MGYRYSKARVCGVQEDLLARFANDMTHVDFLEFIINHAKVARQNMMQDYSIEEVICANDSEGVALIELLNYRDKCIETWSCELEEFQE